MILNYDYNNYIYRSPKLYRYYEEMSGYAGPMQVPNKRLRKNPVRFYFLIILILPKQSIYIHNNNYNNNNNEIPLLLYVLADGTEARHVSIPFL